MERLCILLLFSFSFSSLFSQRINFKDKNNLTSTLCGKTWIRYYVTNGAISADSTTDSIVFYPNGGFYKSPAPPTFFTGTDFSKVLVGKWKFGSPEKISIHDTTPNYIPINIDCPESKITTVEFTLYLFDGFEIKHPQYVKESGNIKKPFIGFRWMDDSLNTTGYFYYKQK